MAYQAKVFRIMIASPSDVDQERDLVVQAIQDWNNVNSDERKVVLLPLRWETHSRPEMGRPAQEIINTTIVDYCDLLIGIFWTRVGTETVKSQSGTIEEIERVAKAGKPVMLYFSKAPIEPEKIDVEQLSKLNTFKKQTYSNALVENYTGLVEFRDKLSRHLQMKAREFMAGAEGNEEIEQASSISNIDLKWFDGISKKAVGDHIELSGKYFDASGIDGVQDYTREPKKNSSGLFDYFSTGPNRNYFRERILYLFEVHLLRPIQFSLENVGIIGVRDVYVDINIKANDCPVYFISPDMVLNFPSKTISIGSQITYDAKRILTASSNWNVSFEIPAIQPKRTITSKIIGFIGAEKDATIEVSANIFGDCFPEPLKKILTVDFKTERLSLSAQHLESALMDEDEKEALAESAATIDKTN